MSPVAKPKKKRRRERDLSKAVSLRPADIFTLHGIAPSTLHGLCNHPDPSLRLPSILMREKKSKKGVRLVKVADLNAYLDRFYTGRKVA